MNIHSTGRIGIGIITCDREPLFRRSAAALPPADVIVAVNDGAEYDTSAYPSSITKVIQHRSNKGVGRSKNDAIHYLLQQGCDHIFLCEDDVAVADPAIISRYIAAAKSSGIQHFNFGFHGPNNRTPDGRPAPVHQHRYSDGTRLIFNRHLTGAFSYYSREILRIAGPMDRFYRNAYEHVDHTYQIITQDGHPPFGWFADLEGSEQAIVDLDETLSQSVIRKNGTIQRIRLKVFTKYFRWKHGYYPWELSVAGVEELEQWLVRHDRTGNLR